MDMLYHQFIFRHFNYFKKLRQIFFHKTFPPDDDSSSKLTENNQKINSKKEVFLFIV